MRRIISTALIIMLSIAFVMSLLLPSAEAVGVQIISVTPLDHHGIVGEPANIMGTINTTNGLYQLWFGGIKVDEKNATANSVNSTFPVPKLPTGNYTVTLIDVSLNSNATSWFYIDTAYYIEAKPSIAIEPPAQLQEGSTVDVSVNLTGGAPNKLYIANISVSIPAPTSTVYWTLATFNTTSEGEGYNSTIVYPVNFGGAAHTNFVGQYTVAFNKTLATDAFVIGLTNSTEYHRFQLVDIKASGYKSNENVTVRIFLGGKTVNSTDITADSAGLVVANWSVPSNASVNSVYTVNVTSISSNPTNKNPRDVQSFSVPGFGVNMTTRSLAGEIVANVIIQVFENEKSLSNLTSSSGVVQTMLETGNYSTKIFFKSEKVGNFDGINITEAASLDFYCNLTNLKISVLAEYMGTNTPVPEVGILLTSQPDNRTLSTNATGIAVGNILLPNHTYTLNASRYGELFNVTNLPTLLVNGNVTAWYNVTIICPMLTLQVNVTTANKDPISNTPIIAQDLMGGLRYEQNTTANGLAIFNSVVLGRYSIEVLDSNGIKVNETTVDLFDDLNTSIICRLYGLTVSFRVVDFFGQPISNANVALQREGLVYGSNHTQGNGLAIFNRVTGGSMQVSIWLFNQMQPDATEVFYVENSTTIEIKLQAYVLLASFIVNTAVFTGVMITIATVLGILLIEVYRRKRPRNAKA